MVSTLKKLILCTFFACGVAAPLSACDAGDFVDVPATSVEFSSPTLDLFVGQRVALKYSVAPSAARNDKAYWFSSNESVCYVTEGVLMGIGAGDARVTLVLGGKTAELNVHVIDGGSGDVKSINLSTRSMTVGVGKTAPLKAYVNPKSEVVTWVSSNPAVADYSDGNVVANSVGECDITASISDNLSASCHITVTNDAPPGPTPGGDEGWTGNIRVGAPMGEMDFMKSLLAKFNSDTGSSVTFEVTQWEEGNGPDNLPQSLADGPDIYPYVSDQTIGFYQRNALAQLPNSAVADIKAKMGEKYANYAKLNGTSKYIGYPFASDNGYVMFYNKTMAASAGITDMSNVSMTELLQAAKAKDYEVDFEIKVDKSETAGKISFKAPDLLRMDYTNPEEQVICFNGDMLTIYLPESSAVLQQQVSTESSGNAAGLSTPQGLSLMSRYYTVAYETGQTAEPLDDGSDEMVVKFILTRKSAAEAFRYIKVAVNEQTKLIRRVEAVTPKGEEFIFNFYDYKLNQDLTDQRFIYDAPSSANNYNNFLFSE